MKEGKFVGDLICKYNEWFEMNEPKGQYRYTTMAREYIYEKPLLTYIDTEGGYKNLIGSAKTLDGAKQIVKEIEGE